MARFYITDGKPGLKEEAFRHRKIDAKSLSVGQKKKTPAMSRSEAIILGLMASLPSEIPMDATVLHIELLSDLNPGFEPPAGLYDLVGNGTTGWFINLPTLYIGIFPNVMSGWTITAMASNGSWNGAQLPQFLDQLTSGYTFYLTSQIGAGGIPRMLKLLNYTV